MESESRQRLLHLAPQTSSVSRRRHHHHQLPQSPVTGHEHQHHLHHPSSPSPSASLPALTSASSSSSSPLSKVGTIVTSSRYSPPPSTRSRAHRRFSCPPSRVRYVAVIVISITSSHHNRHKHRNSLFRLPDDSNYIPPRLHLLEITYIFRIYDL